MAERDIELIQFDLDGTLIDSVPQLALAVNRMLAHLGHEPAAEQAVRHWVGNGADMLVRRALTAALGEEPDAGAQQAARAAFDAAYERVADQGLVFYPGVLDTLAALRLAGKKLAIVTNKPYRFVPAILAAAGLKDRFELVLGGDSLAVKKPSPEPLLHVCRELDIDPARTLMVGDSENDVLAARAAGIAVVGLTYGYNYGRDIADSGPDWVMSDFAGLATLLRV
ncbi:phosphoglycolate phosphatase [Zobellella endophytica]|uniref:Phosphoglycolate phosphatase n=1 Tax=Zobellella endophytica TaxID=2116700 RepID=A0A2P7R8L8_9GAMM|nr:phosphoglycolate phosphatase [Zobellella endophytica]PSJ46540.1 phosphoglycolate phosphatase [Zobellella endophytica]